MGGGTESGVLGSKTYEGVLEFGVEGEMLVWGKKNVVSGK